MTTDNIKPGPYAPSWAMITPLLLMVQDSATDATADGKRMAREELNRMAKAADLAVELHAALKTALRWVEQTGGADSETAAEARAALAKVRS